MIYGSDCGVLNEFYGVFWGYVMVWGNYLRFCNVNVFKLLLKEELEKDWWDKEKNIWGFRKSGKVEMFRVIWLLE